MILIAKLIRLGMKVKHSRREIKDKHFLQEMVDRHSRLGTITTSNTPVDKCLVQ